MAEVFYQLNHELVLALSSEPQSLDDKTGDCERENDNAFFGGNWISMHRHLKWLVEVNSQSM